MNLAKLLKPKSVALIGASERDSFGGDASIVILEHTKDLSRVYFVNQGRDEVLGRKCYRSISDIEDEIDLVIICTPKNTVKALLREAQKKGCKGAVVCASGYSETGSEGKADQDDLVALCDELDIALMGPNCIGFGNYIDDVFAFAFQTEARERRGNIGLVAQSGQVCISGLDLPNMGFSYFISSGNSAQIAIEEYVSFLVDDEDTKVVCAYIEGIRKPEIFVDALRRAAIKRKPVIILKSGYSEKASELAESHTGSLSGSDKALGAILEKYGVIRVDDLQELYFTAQMFSRLRSLPKTLKYASINASGAEALITADTAHRYGIEWAQFSMETKRKLKELIPDYATINNPLDMTAALASDPEKLAIILSVVLEDENVGAVICGNTIKYDFPDFKTEILTYWREEIMGSEYSKPVLALSFVAHTPPRMLGDWMEKRGVPLLPTIAYGMKMISSLNKFTSYSVEDRNLDFVCGTLEDDSGRKTLTEHESLKELEKAGIVSSKCLVVADKAALRAAVGNFSFPLVMKIDSPDIPHKTEAGGVKLNIGSVEEAEAAFSEIMDNAKRYKKDADIRGVLVREMLPKGTEVIVGVTVDSQFGPFVMVGLGGVFVELFEDVCLYPAPLTKQEALKMIGALKAVKLLEGFRGEMPRDIDALCEIIVRVGDYACKNIDTLKEMDINPLFVYEKGKGAAPADALIVQAASP